MATLKVRNTTGETFDVEIEKIRDAESDGFLPVVTNGKDEHRVAFDDMGSALQDGFKPLSVSESDKVIADKHAEAKPTEGEAAVLGAADTVSLGFADEIAVMVGGSRDRVRSQQREAKTEHPKSYVAGQVAGGVALAPLAPATTTIRGAAAVGAGTGAIMGAGAADELEDVPASMATGAVIGGATGAAGQAIIPAALQKLASSSEAGRKKAEEIVRKMANKQAVRALGGTKKEIQAIGNKADDVGEMLLKEKIVTPLASKKDIANRISAQGEQLASETAPIYKASAESNTPYEQILSKIDDKIAELKSNPGNAPMVAKLERYKADIREAGKSSYNPSEIKGFRRSIDDMINFNSDAPSQQGAKAMRRILRDAEMEGIGRVNPALRQENEALFKKIHTNRLASDAAETGAARMAANNEIGMNSWLASGAGAAAAGPKGLAVGMLREFGRRYGNSTAAVGLNKAADVISGTKFERLFESAAQRGPQAVVVLHRTLMNQSPEYKSLIGGDE